MSETEYTTICNSNGPNPSTTESNVHTVVKLYRRRYLILIILSLALFLNGEVWMTFVSVGNQSSTYFERSESDILWMGNIFLVAFAVEAIPCTIMPQMIGLKGTLLGGVGLNFMGSILRIIATAVEFTPYTRFVLCLLSSLLFGLAQGFLLNIPSLISDVWFGEHERSLSTAIAYMSNALGVGIGFLDIYLLIGASSDVTEISNGFRNISIFEFGLCTFLIIVAIFIVKECPPTPSSISQMNKLKNDPKGHATKFLRNMMVIMCRLLCSYQSLLLLLIFASNYAAYVGMFMFLSDMVTKIATGTHFLVGYIGSIGIILGGINTIVVGYIMNATNNRKNRLIGVVINVCCLLPLIPVLVMGITETLTQILALIFLIIYFAFCPLYISVGCEMLADNTYPTDPNICSNEALILGNILGAVITYSFDLIPGKLKYFVMLSTCIVFYILNSLFLFKTPFQTLRQAAEEIS